MDDDFFTEQHKQDEQFQGYAEVGDEPQHPPAPSHDVTSTALASSAINNSAVNYAQPFEEVEQQQELDETLLRFRQEEEQLLQKLRLKAEDEAALKRKRKEKGSKDLAEFLAEREKQVEANRAVYRENAKGPINQNYVLQALKQRNSWEKVADNIALKAGDYPGTKDVARMREAIVNKRQDELEKK